MRRLILSRMHLTKAVNNRRTVFLVFCQNLSQDSDEVSAKVFELRTVNFLQIRITRPPPTPFPPGGEEFPVERRCVPLQAERIFNPVLCSASSICVFLPFPLVCSDIPCFSYRWKKWEEVKSADESFCEKSVVFPPLLMQGRIIRCSAFRIPWKFNFVAHRSSFCQRIGHQLDWWWLSKPSNPAFRISFHLWPALNCL